MRAGSPCLHEIFEQRVLDGPDRAAVSFGEETLSYDELNRRANQLAHFLRGRGVGRDTLVGLCLDRSLDTVISILAVLKAGAAYVPMDPSNPPERVRMIVEDAQCSLILVHEAQRARFPDSDIIIVLDGPKTDWDSCSECNPEPLATMDGLAYVIFTSGSTGKPKGVPIAHRNVTRLFTSTIGWFDFSKNDTWTLFHSFAFDFSVWECWGALLHGGKLIVVPYWISRSPENFHQLLVEQKVTVLNQTPSAFTQIQAHDLTLPLEQSRRLALRYVIFGGEALSFASLAPWFARHGDEQPRIINMYGITETTVFVTYRRVRLTEALASVPSYIGVPIPDQPCHVVRRDGRPADIGEEGELYVGGAGNASGYLNRPDLSIDKFIPSPFPEDHGAILYRSGDLVRRLDGDMVYLGRIDRQVQLRGFRVELGEIEAQMVSFDGIQSAAVLAHTTDQDYLQLVGFYVSNTELQLNVLREHLASALPEYMIPSGFIRLEAMPLTGNGKTDYRALPEPVIERENTEYIAPRNETERKLATLWQELLQIQEVGVEDNFFALGGHSLLATRLLFRINEAFDIRLPLRALNEAPSLNSLAELLDAALLDCNTDSEIELHRADRAQPIPLSFAQERLWFIEQLDPGNAAYVIPILFEMKGPIDIAKLRRSLEAIVSRHEVLRTTFRKAAGSLVQIIEPVAKVDLQFVPSESVTGDEDIAARVRGNLSHAASAPVNLESGPLAKFIYYAHRDEHNFLGLLIHHAVFDGWSISILLNDLKAAYTSLEFSESPCLKPMDLQYADYGSWQRSRYESGALQRHLEYWRQQLAAPLPVLEIPADFPRPPHQTWRGAVARGQINVSNTSRLEQLAVDQCTTLFTVLIAAWQLLLRRYSGQEEILIGCAIAGRTHPALESMIGFFVNTVAIRARLLDRSTFVELLETENALILDAQEHQDLPFDRVVAEVREEQDPSRSPVFQVMFVLHNTPSYDIRFSGLHIAGEELNNGCAKFDLSLAVQPGKGGLALSLEYNTSLFRAETVERMLRSYETLLQSILENPEGRLGEFQIVEGAERTLLLETWTDTAFPLNRTQSLNQLFEDRAAENPDCIAVADDDTSLTYGELDARANQLAHYLLSLGVSLEEPVPFFLSRSVHVITLIIGILKAGGAYVPLDLLDPPGRRERVLKVLQPRIVLTESSLLSQISGTTATLQCLDDASLLDDFPTHSPGIRVGGENLAYVFFTSGSTGDPKGVSCTHQGVINLYQDLQSRCAVGPGDACSLWTAFSFDISVYESWTSLLAGATLHIIPERVRPNPRQCLEWLRQRNITTGYIQGFMLPELLEMQRESPLPFQRLLVGLEPLPESLLCEILAATPGLVLLNWYGPTEAAIYCTLYQVHDRQPRPNGNAPIGKALQNMRMYVLDPNRNLLPIGVPGELYIGGVGLARGYYNAPELTARQFVSDPFTELDSRRLYRTGDLVYFKEDGNLQFIRRMDRYIKLRGYRIEPGEIESILREFPGIDDAVVLLNEKGMIGPRLVAYLATETSDAITDDALTEFLKARLPAHMCPAQFVMLAQFPRTVQGKLDRKALPEPTDMQETTGTEATLGSDIERALAVHWQALLKVADVGPRDNFFRLGGDSLVLIQLASRIREQFKVDLPLRLLLDSPTVETQAKALESQLEPGVINELPGSIPVAERDKTVPLSFAQEQLWFIEQLQPGNTAYHIPLLITISGELNSAHFVEALRMLAQRHEALRTVFYLDSGTPTQRFLESLEISASIITMDESADETELRSVARKMLNEAAQEIFDLTAGPLFRLTLLKAGPDRWFALFVVHHIIFDGWSIRVLLEEWSEFYTALSEHRKPELRELTIQHADYAAWQHHVLDTPEYGEQLSYWRVQLTGAPPIHELPVDFSRPIHQTWDGALAETLLNIELSHGIVELARHKGKTLFTLLFAAWSILMHRYSGQSDAVIGTALSGRHRKELEPLLGMFVHTVALRTQVDRDATMNDYLNQVEAIVIEAQEHQEVPFERVVAALLEERDPSRSPLFQVVFVLDEMMDHVVRAGGLTLTVESVHNNTAKFDLTMNVSQLGNRLKLSLEYNTSLFRAETLERMLRSYETLLASIVARPDGRLDKLEIVSKPDRALLLETWTDTAYPLDRTQSLHQLFEQRASEFPDSIAVADDDTSLTYGELNARANQVAHYLLARGVTPEEPVPFFLGRTVRAIVAIVGILKAGAAYVPLDLLDPPVRRARVLSVLKPRMILTEFELAPQLSDTAMECVCLDEPGLLDEFSTDSPDIGANGENLAYVIFTSGSTGDPKGVCCTHQGVINLYQDLQSRLSVGPGDACSLWTAFSFDISVYESWTSLLAGATLHIIPERVRPNPRQCLNWLLERQVTTGYIQGFMLPTLLDMQRETPLPLRRMLVGLEPLPESMLCDILEATPGLVLLNWYGPTEAAIYCTLYQVLEQKTRPEGNAPIGKPLQNMRMYVLDSNRNLLPIGVPGELYIGGVGLARGYYDAPELTRRQFVPDPFTELDTRRLYRTGDLVYFKEDGNIQFVRRMDRYIKLRGYRIEPGEIESCLREFPGVDDAVVLLNEGGGTGPKLVAYIATQRPHETGHDDLANHLKMRLPAHMCPQQFVTLPAFPRTVQGKLDRKALPEPGEYSDTQHEEAAFQNDLERELATLWRVLLKLETVGRHDNFFRLGGDSLVLIQLASRLRDHFDVEVPLRLLLESPTIEDQSTVLEELLQPGAANAIRNVIPTVGRDTPLPLSFSQEQLWFIEQLQPGNTAYHIPLLITLSGTLNSGDFIKSLELLTRRHEVLRTVFLTDSGRPIQRILSSVVPPVRVVNGNECDDDNDILATARRLLAESAREPFDLGLGPLFRVTLLETGTGHNFALLVVHHIIFDGWSIRVLLEDWSELYAATAGNRTPALAPLGPLHADYAAWQHRSMESGAFDEQLAYWTQRLADAPPVHELPMDFSRPVHQTWKGALAEAWVSSELSGNIVALGREKEKSLFTLLFSAWALLMYRYTGQQDSVMGTALSGRHLRGLEPLLGMFVNTVALRTQTEGHATLDDFLHHVESAVVEAQEHQDAPFERVVAALLDERDPSRSPLFQVIFVVDDMMEHEVKREGLLWTVESVHNHTAKFDLSMNVSLQGARLKLSLEYNTSLFRASTAERMLSSYETLLESILENPSGRLSELQVVDGPERALLLETWTDTAYPFDRTQSLHQLFEARAAEFPDCVAVADDDTTLTYGELDARANQVAHYLLARGVTPEEPVPLFLGRTVRVIVTVIGILKAGAAYVPLDLLDPPVRRARVLSVLKPRMILTEFELAPQLNDTAMECVCLDEPGLLDGFSTDSPDIGASGENLAYVIFTSGSTGDPKGVCCTHQGVINLFQDLQARRPIGPRDACSAWASFSFDASVYEIWTAILAGASLYICPDDARVDPSRFIEWLRQRYIVSVYLPAFILSALLENQSSTPLPLRRAMVGVEPIPEHLLCEIVENTPGLFLINAYGPTEAAIYVTLYQVGDTHPRPTGNAPIGTAIQNTRIYVLDPAMNPLPIGVPGELYIGGVGLARGYYDAPELTQRQFVPDPFTELDTRRLYRTGDLVYFKEDGNLQFIRRMDRYIKLRGYRVEPGEIESILREFPGIDDAVVLLNEKGTMGPRLVAYLATETSDAITDDALTEFLKARLPAHMCPAQFVMLAQFPRTVQGKLDRKALPEPPSPAQSSQPLLPQNETEIALASIWERHLGVPVEDSRANFFALGGHSLLAIQVVSEVNEQLQSCLTLEKFFEHPTIEALSSTLTGSSVIKGLNNFRRLVKLNGGTSAPFFCVKAVGDVGGSYQTLVDALSESQPFYAFQILGFGAGDGYSTMESLAAQCIGQIKAVQPEGPYCVGGYSFGGIVSYEIARQLIATGDEVSLIAMLDSATPEHGELGSEISVRNALRIARKIRGKLIIFSRTWKLQLGYARDAIRIFWRRFSDKERSRLDAPSAKDYWKWTQSDSNFQYYLIQAGLARPTIRERRLEMFDDQWIREGTKSIEAGQRAMSEYEMEPINAHVTLFRAAHDPIQTHKVDPTFGWGRYARKGVKIVEVPGNHMVIIRPPYATELGKLLQRAIDESREITR